MSRSGKSKHWLRELVEFALDEDVNAEIERQRRILASHPRSAKAHYDLAVLLYSQRRTAEAITEFHEAIACEPSFAQAHRKLGEVYVCLGDYEEGAKCALKAAKYGDRTLLEMFERYPAFAALLQNHPEKS